MMNWSTGLTIATLAAMGIGAVIEIMTNKKAENAKQEAKAEIKAELDELWHENTLLKEDICALRIQIARHDVILSFAPSGNKDDE
jgi:hypothetical protein